MRAIPFSHFKPRAAGRGLLQKRAGAATALSILQDRRTGLHGARHDPDIIRLMYFPKREVNAPFRFWKSPVSRSDTHATRPWILLCISFFVSGMSALIYQICWQRALFGAVGVDMDSVTLIVSCFMLGIGIGGALGGVLADALPGHMVKVYAAAETLLAVFGLLSLSMVRLASESVAVAGAGGLMATGAVVFAVLVLPTTLMGVTLPVLTMAFDRLLKNVGLSVGTLYFWNTLGAATAAWLCPFILFDYLTLNQAVQLAAAGNITVAVTALVLARVEGQAV